MLQATSDSLRYHMWTSQQRGGVRCRGYLGTLGMACCHGGVRIRVCRFGVPAVVAETARTSSCLVRGDAVLCIGRRDGGVVRVFWVMGSYRIPPLHCAGCFSCGFLGIGVTVPGGQAPDMGAPISGGCACVSDCFSWGSLHHRSD